MVDALSSRVAAGLEGRRHAELLVAGMKAASKIDAMPGEETSTRPEQTSSDNPAVIKLFSKPDNHIEKAVKGTEEDFQRTLRFLQFRLEASHTTGFYDPPELVNYEGTKTYAEVVVGDKVVATVDNQGVVRADNSMQGLLQGKLKNEVNGTNGPDLAQARADQIAQMLGGQVKKTDTAITQERFASLAPPPKRELILDRAGMESDPLYGQIQELIQKRAEYMA